MKMIIVLDKICLLGVIGISVYIGYQAGVVSVKEKDTISALHKVFANQKED